MLSKLLVILIPFFSAFNTSKQDNNYTFIFDKIDNKVEILVNDSIVYTSGTIDNNPNLGKDFQIYLGNYLTEDEDRVVLRVYNGHEPYENEEDQHWEIKYVLNQGSEEYDYVWEYADDNTIGLVFEEEYKL